MTHDTHSFRRYRPDFSQKGVWTPTRLIKDKSLKDSDLRFLLLLFSHSQDFIVYQSVSASFLGWGEDKMRNCIKRLEKAGYIKRSIIRRDGKIHHYHYDFDDKPSFLEDNKVSDSHQLNKSDKQENQRSSDKKDLKNEGFTEEKLVGCFQQPEKPGAAFAGLTKTKETNSKETSLVCCAAGGCPPLPIEKILSCKKLKTDGSMLVCDLQELFTFAVTSGKDWSTGEIKEAWNILIEYKGKLFDWIAFIEGTINNIRKKKLSQNITKTKYKDKLCKPHLTPQQMALQEKLDEEAAKEQKRINDQYLANAMKGGILARTYGVKKSR